MFAYIFYDLKRALFSKWAKIYIICTAALILIANIAVICFRFIYGSNEGTFAYNVFEYASWCFPLAYYSCVAIGVIAYGKEYIRPYINGIKAETKGGKISLKPWQMYVAKLIEAVIVSVVFMVIAFLLLYVLTQIFHLDEGMIPLMILRLFLGKAVLAIPLWFAGVAFAMMFLFLFDSKWKALAGFAILAFLIPQIIRIFSLDGFDIAVFRAVRRFTITQSFALVPYPSYPDRSVPLIITLGIVYGVVATAVGMIGYNKKAS